MPEGVVDLLELVQVEDDHRGAGVAGPLGQGLLQAVMEERPVRQPGQRVVGGSMPAFGGLAKEDPLVPARHDEAAGDQGQPDGESGDGDREDAVLDPLQPVQRIVGRGRVPGAGPSDQVTDLSEGRVGLLVVDSDDQSLIAGVDGIEHSGHRGHVRGVVGQHPGGQVVVLGGAEGGHRSERAFQLVAGLRVPAAGGRLGLQAVEAFQGLLGRHRAVGGVVGRGQGGELVGGPRGLPGDRRAGHAHRGHRGQDDSQRNHGDAPPPL